MDNPTNFNNMDNQSQQKNSKEGRKFFSLIKIFSLNNRFFSVLVGLVIAGVLCTSAYILATFDPGATLDPGCNPGDAGCTIKAPLTDGFVDDFIGTGDFITTGSINNGTVDFAGTNSRLGYQALFGNTTGGNNTALGYQALYSNTTTSFNTAVGHSALFYNTSTQNTAVGAYTLYFNTSGVRNTAVGYGALRNNITGSDNIAAGWGALGTNVSGVSNVAFGNHALSLNITGFSNTAVGKEALYYNTASNNSAFGYQSLRSNTSGIQNTAFGYQSLRSNTTGYSNTATGYKALHSNTTGYDNAAIGYNALYSNTTGWQNTANGVQALYSNTEGMGNTAIGWQALYSNSGIAFGNTAIGEKALYSNTEGVYNVASGVQALYSNATGSLNIAIGNQTLYNNIVGEWNTAVGSNALLSVLGYRNVGLGSSAGSHETGSNSFYVDNQDRTDTAGDKAEALLYGIFNSAPASQMLTINAQTIKMPYLPTADNTAVHIDGSGNLTKSTSSLRYKHDIQPLAENWTVVLQLQPKSFKYNGTNQSSVGYIAEDFESLGLKDLLVYDNEGKPDAIKYEKLSLYSIEILKQQQIAINELKQHLGITTDNTAINLAGTLGSGEVSGVNISSFDQSVQSSLSKLGATLTNGIISLKQVITDNLTAKTADIAQVNIQKMQIVDQATGDIYCTWIYNGEWQKAKGDCASVSVATPIIPTTPETPVTPETPATSTEQTSQQLNDLSQQITQQQQATQEAQQTAEQAQQTAEQAQEEANQAQQTAEQVQEEVQQVQEQVQQSLEATPEETPEEPTILESISGLIQNAVAGLLNGAWNLLRWVMQLLI